MEGCEIASRMTAYINRDTQLCMSLSARPGNFGTRFQNYLYRELKLNFVYKAFTTQNLQAAIGGIRALGIRGCAVSMPFKEACIEMLDELDATAQGIQSVNTIVNTAGRLKGYNTDYAAVVKLLQSREVPIDFSFAVRGSGGMAKAVVCALRDLGFKKGIILARNPRTGQALADQYGFSWQEDLGDAKPNLIINVSPIGMAGGKESNELAFSPDVIESAQIVFDVVAVPVETPLYLYTKKLNAQSESKKIICGADVLSLQAVEQFVLYTGIRPQQGLIDRAAAFALDSSLS